jgi:hypothetical protein
MASTIPRQLRPAFGSHDRVDAFEYNGRLFAAMDTCPDRGNEFLERTRLLRKLTFGRIEVGHEPRESSKRVVVAYRRRLQGFQKSSVAWMSVPKADYSGTAFLRVMSATGPDVVDHRDVFHFADSPKLKLWPFAEKRPPHNECLEKIFPEMVESYNRRSWIHWCFLIDTIPGKPTAENIKGEHLRYCRANVDVSNDDFTFVYMADQHEWVPQDLLSEYRFYRLRQRRLQRTLRKHAAAVAKGILLHVYRCPDGGMYKKTATMTMVGRI